MHDVYHVYRITDGEEVARFSRRDDAIGFGLRVHLQTGVRTYVTDIKGYVLWQAPH